ncbi:MAG: hypothetical protein J3Q66DRAFT_370566 [Benniella sp.]|nr:MAG: hypothetical protein J3Q66DRAFT_370566 [Benniella sp.]
MASYEGLRKLTLGDKPVVIKSQVPTFNELCFIVQRLFRSQLSTDLDNIVLRYEDDDGDLITIQDDADISHAMSLSNVLKLTVNDKVTHPIVVPIEHLPSKLVGMDEKQTIAAVTAALVDLQGRIGKALQVIQSQHPAALLNGTAAATGATSSGAGGREPAADGGVKSVESKPLVLSAASLDELLSPKSLLTRQTSVSSQSLAQQNTLSSSVSQGVSQATYSNGAHITQVPAQQQQLTPSQSWTPQSGQAPSNAVPQQQPQPQAQIQQQPQQQQYIPQNQVNQQGQVPGQGYAQQQPQQPQQQPQPQQTPYMQPAYIANPYQQQQQQQQPQQPYPSQPAYNPVAAPDASSPFARSNSVYLAQQ